ncbi:TonB-dependent receptor, partial [Acidobacteriia bacterium AH_259_A11_L15]|nr:TonB-dependent receptor [Acidobacteriia bacterium AH_259_A11_L15]
MKLRIAGRFAFFAVLAALLVALPAASQVLEKGSITGTVYDPSGAVVPGATVRIINVATGAEREVSTSSDGRYAAAVLPVGEYRIEVTKSGFATAIVREVRLAVGQELIQDVTLQLGAAAEQVVVTAEAGPINRSESRPNVVIDQTYVENLPISGRDFRDFVKLSGTADTSPALRSPVRLNGQQGEFTGFLVDGVDQRNSFFGEWFGSLETTNFTFPQDAIQEFQVRDSGLSAEFGHSTGGLINVVTKSGTNEWHGTVHWFFQTNSLIASTAVPANPNLTIPPNTDTRHQFGGTVGGPIKRDKAFIFFAIQAQERKGPISAVFGDAGGIRTLCPPCPLPSEFGGGELLDLERQPKERQDLFAPFLRFDYNITDNHIATTRFNYTRNETDGFKGFAGNNPFVIGRVENNFENFVNEGFVIGQSLTSVIGPRSVNEFRFSFSQEKRPRRTRADFTQETAILDGTGNFGPVFFLPIDSEHKRLQFIDNFSHTFGKHDLKFGVDLNSNATNQIFIGFAGGAYFFGSLADFIAREPLFLLQRVGIGGLTATESGSLSDFWQHELSFYIQDTWRIHPRVTLNLGLRWDGVWNPDSEFGLPAGTVPVGKPRITGNGVEVDLAPTTGLADIPNDFNNWAPRVGVAWDATGDGKTIVRGGLGLYYSATSTIFWAGTLAGPGLRGGVVFIPFFGSPTDLLGLGLSYPDLAVVTPFVESLLPPPAIDYADPDLESVRVLNIQIGVEREIVPDLSISGTYTYNRSENLRTGGFFSTPWDRNVFCDPATVTGCVITATSATIPASQFDQFGRTIDAFNLPRLDPGLGITNAITSFGKARYHAFLLQVKKTFSDRFQFGINYT